MKEGYRSNSDSEEEVQEIIPPSKAPTKIFKIQCLYCSLPFASGEEYLKHSEIHVGIPNPRGRKRRISQIDGIASNRGSECHKSMHVKFNASNVLPPPTMAMERNVVNQHYPEQVPLNLTLAPPPRPISLDPTLGIGANVPPPNPKYQFQHGETEIMYVKHPRNAEVGNQMNGGASSDAGSNNNNGGGGCSSSAGSSSNNNGNGDGSNSSNGSNYYTVKPFNFDLNLFPPSE